MTRPELSPALPVLIIDDDPAVVIGMTGALSSAGVTNVLSCQDSRKVIDLLASTRVGVILLDLTMPHVSGQELLTVIRDGWPEIPVIVVTGVSDVGTAVQCMKLGAFDYLVKAVERTKLTATVSRAIQIRELEQENSSLRKHLVEGELEHPEHFREIITRDERMRSLLMYLESVAETTHTVLITGETGTGKELVARALHAASGRRGELVTVNVAGLEENLFADTLFGHARGAFTGADQQRKGLIERAAHGTLFLDEIGDLSPASQVRLLRLVEAREYYPLGSDVPRLTDARIVAATSRDLGAEAREGRYRRDLYYRLRTHRVALPPLRERPEDIPPLVDEFLREAAAASGREPQRISSQARALLSGHAFPGNVRELRALVYDAVSRHKGGEIPVSVFQTIIGSDAEAYPAGTDEPLSFSGGFPTLRQATEHLISTALERSGGNQARAARLLGISPQALSKRLKGSRES
jgi:DNA-binding NtrC family response regulator